MQSKLRQGDPPPKAIVDGITDSITHLSNSYVSGLTPEAQARHISLALDALIENTYLCHQVTVISINEEISVICDDPLEAKHWR